MWNGPIGKVFLQGLNCAGTLPLILAAMSDEIETVDPGLGIELMTLAAALGVRDDGLLKSAPARETIGGVWQRRGFGRHGDRLNRRDRQEPSLRGR
jgi:hypothetical protein